MDFGVSLQQSDHLPLRSCVPCAEVGRARLRREDMAFIEKMVDKTAVERLRHVAATPFKRLSYTEAVAILEDVVKSKKKKFQFPVRPPPHWRSMCLCRTLTQCRGSLTQRDSRQRTYWTMAQNESPTGLRTPAWPLCGASAAIH